MCDETKWPEFDLPTAGAGHHMRAVLLEHFDEDGFEVYEDILVWFKKPPRPGMRFSFRGETWRVDGFTGSQWVAELVL